MAKDGNPKTATNTDSPEFTKKIHVIMYVHVCVYIYYLDLLYIYILFILYIYYYIIYIILYILYIIYVYNT